ncbi:hypothetical protein ACROYT_G036012 [Oculina patagonica]
MKRFIFAVVLLSIVCTLLSDEVMGSSIRNKREKPGQCPKPGIGTCVEGCSGDGDCNGEDKCCFNGCGHTCMKPVKPPKPGWKASCAAITDVDTVVFHCECYDAPMVIPGKEHSPFIIVVATYRLT